MAMDPLTSSKKINDLPHQDALSLLELIHASLSCVTEEGFRNLIAGVKNLIPFDYAACLMGQKTKNGVVVRYDAINISYPAEWSYHYVAKNYHLIDPVFKENFSTFSLQYWRDTYKKKTPRKEFVMEAQDFGLHEGYSIGQRTLDGSDGSLFSYAGKSIRQEPRTELILRYITPHLHQVFIRLLKHGTERNTFTLSTREREILCWVKEGKSTWDISVILGISQDTVKFHMKRIFQKLNTNSRSHAIAIALGKKLIDF